MLLITPEITALQSPFLSSSNTGLGNVLFQVASVYGLAKKTRRQFSSYFLKQYCDVLKTRFQFHHDECIFQRLLQTTDYHVPPTQTLYDMGGKNYDANLLPSIEASTDECILVKGHLECPMYFHEYKSEIQSMFLHSMVQSMILSKIPTLVSSDITPISVHIRNAYDAVQFPFHYYNLAVQYIKDRVTHPHFFVFVDDVNRMPFDPKTIGMDNFEFVHFNEDFLDMIAIAMCTHHISSISTFAWWGSYLSSQPNKIITIARSAAEFMKKASRLTETQFLENYYMGCATVLENC